MVGDGRLGAGCSHCVGGACVGRDVSFCLDNVFVSPFFDGGDALVGGRGTGIGGGALVDGGVLSVDAGGPFACRS